MIAHHGGFLRPRPSKNLLCTTFGRGSRFGERRTNVGNPTTLKSGSESTPVIRDGPFALPATIRGFLISSLLGMTRHHPAARCAKSRPVASEDGGSGRLRHAPCLVCAS
jgi:hypothetical protein